MKSPALILSCAMLLAPCAAAPASAAPGSCSTIVLTGHPTYPPVSWSANGTLRGAGIAVVRRLADDAGARLRVIDEGSWDAAQSAVKSGKADAIVGIYRTQARLPYYDYVEPAFAEDPSSVLVRAADPFVYKGWESLVGKRGAVSAGESYGHAFDTFMRDRLTVATEDGFDGVYRAVLQGRAAYGLAGYYAALSGAPAGLRIAEKNFVTEGLYLAFGKGSPCGATFARRFGADIVRLTRDGTVKRLLDAGIEEYKSAEH